MKRRGSLITELRLFIRLRWLAGGILLLVANLPFLRNLLLSSYGNFRVFSFIGVSILFYNCILWLWMFPYRIEKPVRTHLLVLACSQLLLDLASLTVLTLLTGGIQSPLKSFFVFHMIFCSLLLPHLMAMAGAGVAMLMLTAGLWLTGQWPANSQENMSMLAWMVLMLVTVWMTNGITRNLRQQSRRLRRQNKRILAISRDLRRHQSALVQQEKMATAGRMASGVVHEIANPLASMDSLLQLMSRNPDKVRTTAVSTLREQVARINGIIRRMTAFAHPGTGDWQPVNPDVIVEKALEMVQFDPRGKGVKINRKLAADLPPVKMVPEAIQQVLINLISNAFDAMEGAADPNLTVRTSRKGKYAVIDITDTGTGISEDAMSRLFDPFFTTKPVGKGTGLGLSIAYNFVREHQGYIAVSTTAGKGSTFSVHLPVVDARAGLSAPPTRLEPDPATESAQI
jgi:signal transduction histidine kinase